MIILIQSIVKQAIVSRRQFAKNTIGRRSTHFDAEKRRKSVLYCYFFWSLLSQALTNLNDIWAGYFQNQFSIKFKTKNEYMSEE